MAITNEQRLQRKKFLGSSDIAALFTDKEGKSLDPFNTSVDLWASKVFELKEMKKSPAMDRGNRYESALIAFAESELGCGILTASEHMGFICKDHPIFACNLDGHTVDIRGDAFSEIVEAKTTGLTGEWGEPGTDDVPFRVNLQCQQQMLCTGWKKAHIAVLLGKWGLTEEMYVVDRNEDIINAIIERGEQFWKDHVLTKIPPEDGQVGDVEIFKRIIRQPNKFADVSTDLILDWSELRRARLDAEKAEKAKFAEILVKLGDAEGVNMGDEGMFTYFTQRGADTIDRELLKTNYPDVYDAVSSPNEYPVARIKKA